MKQQEGFTGLIRLFQKKDRGVVRKKERILKKQIETLVVADTEKNKNYKRSTRICLLTIMKLVTFESLYQFCIIIKQNV